MSALNTDSRSSSLQAVTITLLRVVSALTFIQHGTLKLFGFPANPEQPFSGAPPALSMIWVAGALEVVGGILMALGLFTRPVAFILAGEMAVAYFMAHFPRSFYPVVNGGEASVLFCFIFLHFAATGAGPYSVDAALMRNRRSQLAAP